MSERFTLQPGQWFTYPLDTGIPSTVRVYEGAWEQRHYVASISKMQALALARWYAIEGLWFSVQDGNNRWRDVRLVGDIEAWYGYGNPPVSTGE